MKEEIVVPCEIWIFLLLLEIKLYILLNYICKEYSHIYNAILVGKLFYIEEKRKRERETKRERERNNERESKERWRVRERERERVRERVGEKERERENVKRLRIIR